MPDPVPVILVGAGARARAWWSLSRQSPRLMLVAQVSRSSALPDWTGPSFPRLADALREFPQAAVAAALPPRAGLECALTLAQAGRAGVVEAPLAAQLLDAPLPEAASRVQVAHGWVTLSGRSWAQRVLAAQGATEATLEVRGLPEQDSGDLDQAIAHAAALVSRLFPSAQILEATSKGDGFCEARLQAGSTSLQLRVITRGSSLDLTFGNRSYNASWHWEPDTETVHLRPAGGQSTTRQRPTPSGATRALQQLIDPTGADGDTLVEAAHVAVLTRDLMARLPAPVRFDRRRLRQAAELSKKRPDDVAAQLGLVASGPLPDAPPLEPHQRYINAKHLEVWPFRAGLKPVAFLTTRPEFVDLALAQFQQAVGPSGTIHFERRDRLVQVGPQDQWTDRRDVGEPWVELYISRDPALAARAAHIQADLNPSQGLRELGSLMGYPACCVDAFAEHDDRSNNTRNRYIAVARTFGDGPWPAELNNLFCTLYPFFACQYRCQPAVEWVRGSFAELGRDMPEEISRLRPLLAQPILYFDHERKLVFRGTAETASRLRYQQVWTTPEAPDSFRRWAGVFALGDTCTFDERALVITRGSQTIAAWDRTDPALGFLAPFGA